MTVYSEHLIAALHRFTDKTYVDGAALDDIKGAPQVQIGKIIGLDIGAQPSDANLAWWARTVGTSAPAGSRAAIHILPGDWVGVGLGGTRGVIESTGDHLAIVRHPEADRYTGVYRLPTIQYGGLL